MNSNNKLLPALFFTRRKENELRVFLKLFIHFQSKLLLIILYLRKTKVCFGPLLSEMTFRQENLFWDNA